MKFVWFFAALILFDIVASAQSFAIINDPDGYVNVREAKTIKSKITGKLYDGQIFFYDRANKTDTWCKVFCSPGNYISYPEGKSKYPERSSIKGFVSADRITPIENLPHPKLSAKIRQLTPNSLTISWDSVTLIVTSKKFQPNRHKIEGTKAMPALTIDNKHPYGHDGGMPHIEISDIFLTTGNTKIEIPAKAFNDLYEPSFENWNIYRDKRENFYIMSLNSDGAGGYYLVFIFHDGKFVGRYIDQP